ncbi:Uncharacterised protein, partial [Mycoplasma putrefaciens]
MAIPIEINNVPTINNPISKDKGFLPASASLKVNTLLNLTVLKTLSLNQSVITGLLHLSVW